MFHFMILCYVSSMYKVVVNTWYSVSHVVVKPFARILYLFLMKDIGRWLPSPGCCTGQQDDFIRTSFDHNPYANWCYIARIEDNVTIDSFWIGGGSSTPISVSSEQRHLFCVFSYDSFYSYGHGSIRRMCTFIFLNVSVGSSSTIVSTIVPQTI